MSVFYNECDPFAAQWLRNLLAAGHIAPGVVDERPIQEIEAFELSKFTQCHFFAGIGIWSYALRQAGWPDDRPIWTGSCPCQPFSNAGQKKGISDERHLWPFWQQLIAQQKPSVVVGEQVASKDGLGWLDLVSADLEASDYAFGAGDLCAAGFGGAHIRQRLYFVGVGNAFDQSREREAGSLFGAQAPVNGERVAINGRMPIGPEHAGAGMGGLADDDARLQGWQFGRDGAGERAIGSSGMVRRMADDDEQGSGGRGILEPGKSIGESKRSAFERSSGLCENNNSHAPLLGRHAVDWLYCRDGKWRPVESGTFPLVDAAPQRVGRLRAYGNALDAETATQFCAVIKEICDGV